MSRLHVLSPLFFFNDTATTEIYTLSLHDALPISIGSPDATRSHFDAQDYMESGTPGVKATPDGWLNRYCRHDREHQDTPFRAVAFGAELPRILAGSAPSLAIADLQAFGLRAPQPAARDRLTRAFEELYAGSAPGLLSTSSQEAVQAVAV